MEDGINEGYKRRVCLFLEVLKSFTITVLLLGSAVLLIVTSVLAHLCNESIPVALVVGFIRSALSLSALLVG